MNPTGPLEEWEMDELDRFLLEHMAQARDSDENDEGLLGMSELDGFFTAIVSGPQTIPPSTWLSAVWGDREPAWESVEGFEKVYQLMLRHYNDVVNSLMAPGYAFEPVFNESEVDGRRYLEVNDWCLGYMRGVALAVEAWDSGGDELFELLQPIMLFCDESGLQVLDIMDEEEIAGLQTSIPTLAQEIQRFWLVRRRFTLLGADDRLESEQTLDADALCPCGSGKPFRKCCLH
jgi:uncharacterized protein